MTSSPTAPQDCPNSGLHGNPFRYCPSCTWIEEAPAPGPNDALGELTTLILGKTATAAAQAVLDAGYVKAQHHQTCATIEGYSVEADVTPCCGAADACRDCPTD
jgi:hypothetical protein